MPKILFTIGYEGQEISAFVDQLREAGVRAIADVRAVAVSRKQGFSKRALSARVEAAGMAYRHFIELGDPKEGRLAARAGQYEVFERVYAKHLATSQAESALVALKQFAGNQPTCLLCFERDPSFCHRSRIASALVGSGFVIRNLIAGEPTPDGDRTQNRKGRHAGQGAPAT